MMSLFLATLLALAGQDLPGAKPQQEKPVVKVLAVRPEKAELKAGETVAVAFDFEIPPGWHIYPAGKKPLFGTQSKFQFENAEIAGPITEPAPKLAEEKVVGPIDFHEGKITITVPLKLKDDAALGPLEVKGRFIYQICDPKFCHDGETALAFTLTLKPSPPGVTVKSVTPSKAELKLGETVVLAIEVEISKNWHIYPTYPTTTGTPTSFEFPGLELAGKIEEPKAKIEPAQPGAEAYDYHEGTLTFKVPVRLKDGAKPGPLDVAGEIRYQLCNPKTCLQPSKTPLALKLAVQEGKVDVPDRAQQNAQNEYEKLGLAGFLLLAVGGGLISLVMPCVFPIVPITVTYFIKQGDGSRSKAVFLALAYSLGIIVAFTGIGSIFSAVLGADGARRFAADMWVNVVVAGLFFWFAFSLFGLYEISLPSGLVGNLTGQQRKGAGGAFILGVLFSVVTFTCTIPIAGTILAVSASGAAKYRFIGVLAMLVYSTTMAVPFFLLGVFPTLIQKFRKSGGDWLHTVKVTMAFAELALACFYLSKADNAGGWGVVTRFVMVAVWVSVLIFMILYLLRVFQLKGDEPDPAPAADGSAPARRQIGIVRMLIALGLGVLTVSFSTGFDGRQLGWLNFVLPPSFETAEVKESVIGRYDTALEEAKKAGKPVFLEFTGASCINCQVMKGTVLSSAAVKGLVSKFVFAELYTDRLQNARYKEGDNENAKIMLQKIGTTALPAYITLGPDGVERSRLLGTSSESEFVEFLKKGLAAPAPLGSK